MAHLQLCSPTQQLPKDIQVPSCGDSWFGSVDYMKTSLKAGVQLASSSVLISGDGAGWALDEEAVELKRALRRSGLKVSENGFLPAQAVFHMNRGKCLRNVLMGEGLYHGRVGMSYFHGNPGTTKNFKEMFERLRKTKPLIHGIRVSTLEMESLLLNAGFENKVQRIPIGIDVNRFPFRGVEDMVLARERFGIPPGKIVVGNFQKDGDGWKGGDEPKLVKGPDILADALIMLAKDFPDLLVLLAGPSRGYLTRRLSEAGISFINCGVVDSEEVPLLYQALDIYMVASREEGGPKAFLESFATGVKLISSPVGQIVDLADSESAWISSRADAEELAALASQALNSGPLNPKITRAREIAEANTYQKLDRSWREFFSQKLGVTA
jgi:glycosyltransferase involved in cell wall biosynthesis